MRLIAIAVLTWSAFISACGGEANPGVQESTSKGNLVMSLEFDDGPVVGDNVLFVTLADAERARIEKANLSVFLYMPTMGMGSSGAPPKVSNLGNGQYKLSPVVLDMAGEWLVRVSATAEQGSGEKELTFNL